MWLFYYVPFSHKQLQAVVFSALLDMLDLLFILDLLVILALFYK